MTGHIQMMSPEEFKAISVSFKSISPDGTGRGVGKLLSVLDSQGVAVVTDVISQDDVKQLEQCFEDDLRTIIDIPEKARAANPVYQNPIQKWDTGSLPLSSKASAFATDYGLPHGKCGWGARMHPNVRQVYETIFSTDELCVGMDNLFFNPNRAQGDEASREDRLWPHADQNSHLPPQGKYDCYQGVLYLWDCDQDSSATVVWPGSNQSVFPSLMAQRTFKAHFCMLDRSHHAEFVKQARRVPVPSGGLLLWSSKTIHQGWTHGKRLAVPLCFEPTKRRSDEALASKLECCRLGLPTSHWASLGKPHSVIGKGGKGGTEKVPLAHRAHEHILAADGSLNPAIQALL